MKKVISILISFTIIISLICCGCANDEINGADSFSLQKDSQYTYDESENIVLCEELPCYGYIDLAERVSDYGQYEELNEKYNNRKTKINEILSSYRQASDNKDFMVADFKDGVCIVKYNGDDSKVIIPSELDGKKVLKLSGYIEKTELDDDTVYRYVGALDGKEITEIYIPETIQEIAFGFFTTYSDSLASDGKLEKIEVSENNTCFSSDEGLLFDKNKNVLLCVPENYSKNTIAVCDGVETVYEMMCKNTQHIVIPDSVTKITSLTENTYLEENDWYSNGNSNGSLISIKVSEDNMNYSSEGGVLYNKDKTELLIYPCSKKEKIYNVSDSVEKIASIDGDNFKYLKKLTFGKNISEINMHYYEIESSSLQIIAGYKGTVAEKFADKNNIKFIALD